MDEQSDARSSVDENVLPRRRQHCGFRSRGGHEHIPLTLGQDDLFPCRPLSIRPIAENLRVHPLKDRFAILGGQVHVAADDVGLPTADGLQLLFGRALSGEVGGSRVPKVMKAEVGHAGSGACGFEMRVIVIASSGRGTKEYRVVIEPAGLAVLLRELPVRVRNSA